MITFRTEEEIGTDNFHDLNVPEDLIDKFKKMDEAYLNWHQRFVILTFFYVNICNHLTCIVLKYIFILWKV